MNNTAANIIETVGVCALVVGDGDRIHLTEEESKLIGILAIALARRVTEDFPSASNTSSTRGVLIYFPTAGGRYDFRYVEERELKDYPGIKIMGYY